MTMPLRRGEVMLECERVHARKNRAELRTT
jgi:hypothetical protein